MSDYTATNFYNDELSRLKAKQQNTNLILKSQERLAMLNDSYRKRYAKYVQMMTVLVCAVLVYLGITLLQKRFPSIPQFIVDVVTVVLMLLVTIYFFVTISELYSRSVLNYDELDLPTYDSSGVNVSDLEAKGRIFSHQGEDGDACVGEQCCPNYYDTENNVCMSPSVSESTPTTKINFTTLEYEKLESAYTDVKFDSPMLKREPNSQNVKPLQNTTVLTYSKF